MLSPNQPQLRIPSHHPACVCRKNNTVSLDWGQWTLLPILFWCKVMLFLTYSNFYHSLQASLDSATYYLPFTLTNCYQNVTKSAISVFLDCVRTEGNPGAHLENMWFLYKNHISLDLYRWSLHCKASAVTEPLHCVDPFCNKITRKWEILISYLSAARQSHSWRPTPASAFSERPWIVLPDLFTAPSDWTKDVWLVTHGWHIWGSCDLNLGVL